MGALSQVRADAAAVSRCLFGDINNEKGKTYTGVSRVNTYWDQ